jgi:putative DNA primase/helicase
MIPDRDVVPDQMFDREQWVCWTYQCRRCKLSYDERQDDCIVQGCAGEIAKTPINPESGGRAKSDNPETWADYDTALAHVEENAKIQGIGFVFSIDDLFVGIDLDTCRDPETGELAPWAEDIVETLDSFTEISPSGYGLHIIVVGNKPGGHTRCSDTLEKLDALDDLEKEPDVEMYNHGRFFTMSGNILDGHSTLEQRHAELKDVYEEYIERELDLSNRVSVRERRLEEQFSDTKEKKDRVSLDDIPDEVLLRRAFNSEKGDKIQDLWKGNWVRHGYPSQSEADQAFANYLAWWTGHDEFRMNQLFVKSDLYRPKWDKVHSSDGDTYGELTIKEAIRQTSGSYTPGYNPDNESDRAEASDD